MSGLAVELRRYRLALTEPLVTAHGPVAHRDGLVVVVRGGGAHGVGESAPLPSFGTEDVAAASRALEAVSAALAGRDAPGTLAEVYELVASLDLASAPAARCGIETALLDLVARRAGVPMFRLIAPDAAASEIAVSALLASRLPAALATEARRLVDGGVTTLKLKVAGAALDEDLARARAVRAAIGPSALLRIDANGGWAVAEADAALDAFAPLGVELCEQPISPGDPDALARVRARSPIPIAADESLVVRAEAERLLGERPLVDGIVVKPAVLGGILPSLALAARARERRLFVVVTCALEAAIGRAAAAHLAVALGGAHAAGLATARLLAGDLCADPSPPRRGRIVLGDRPGLGIDP